MKIHRPYQPIKIIRRNEAEKRFQEIDKRTGIHTPRPKEESIPRDLAIAIGNDLIASIREIDHNVRVSFAGSIRRELEQVHDIDILVSPYSKDVQKIVETWGEVLWTGPDKISLLQSWQDFEDPKNLTRHIQVDIRFISPESWGPALQYFTGSREHNIRIRAIAKQKKMILNEKGVFDKGGRRIDNNTEGNVYTSIGLRWFPPRYRNETFNREPKPTWCIEHQIKDFCKRQRRLQNAMSSHPMSQM